MNSAQNKERNNYMDLRVKLPIRMIEKLEELRKEWGLQSRSAVVERLLEIVLEEK